MARRREPNPPTAMLNGNPGDRVTALFLRSTSRPDSDGTDFRDVPASDRDDGGYGDAGMLGNYSPSRDRYYSPDDVKRFTGFGADREDLDRGFVEPEMRERAAYDLANYKERLTLPRSPDEDDNPVTASADDLAFRRRHQRSKGFLTRPHIPTDR